MKKIWYLTKSDLTDRRIIKVFAYQAKEKIIAYMDAGAFQDLYHGQEIDIIFYLPSCEKKDQILLPVNRDYGQSVNLQKIAIDSKITEKIIQNKKEYSVRMKIEGNVYDSCMREDADALDDLYIEETKEEVSPIVNEHSRKIVELSVLEEEMTFRSYLHNSFLLHGFYNYGHVIIEKKNGFIRLGVPGNYYDRELMVAKMFGFPDFEPGKGESIQNGTFGYFYTKGNL